MKLTRLSDDCLNKIDCPAIHRTDRRTFVVTGSVVNDPEALATLNLPPGESAVEYRRR
ncbi:MAG: hypothetical protein ACRDYA_15385 [Egibacteraceae bacterium]